ncbi:MAG: amidophosphoribosyltransferase [Candidatus Altiarchaeales archaeon HGW-Altiarchaeales-3]|nr:MAG: amidophosphoribosyltransferase [Candidatus Altiarchaeales archaeon HGW-Altiarchaeales-3]
MKEKCAVLGIYSHDEVFDRIRYGLHTLQHRGQESAGIATYTGKINIHRDMGLVSDVFKHTYFSGNSGIGHVRYSTTGESNIRNAQPLVINYSKGVFAIAHNGNITNTGDLKSLLERRGSIFTTTTDTEIIAQLIAQEHIRTGDFVEGIKNAMEHLEGAYCLTILYEGKIIAVRDPWGFRPLVFGTNENENNKTYIVASESCALDVLSLKLVRDIKPSEILIIDDSGILSTTGPKQRTAHCMFEYVYFSRADSIINKRSVYEVRRNLGSILLQESEVDANLVVPVPDSGITAAVGYSENADIPYGEALMKNRYSGRTFIMPEQNDREIGVRLKLNPIISEIKNREIVLIDDSLVRGNTTKRLIKVLREAGVGKVHVRISCPPIRFPCPYGIDMQTTGEFIASDKSVDEIKEMIGADSLAYISLKGLIDAIGISKDNLCLGCLTGEYPIKSGKQMKLKG